MNDRVEVDIRKAISTAATETSKDLFGMMGVAFIFGVAFAPWFSPFFRYYYETKFNVNGNIRRMALVDQQMIKVNRILWIVAIVSWILIFAAYASYNA